MENRLKSPTERAEIKQISIENVNADFEGSTVHRTSESTNSSKILDTSSEKRTSAVVESSFISKNSDNFTLKLNSYEIERLSTKIDKHTAQLKKGLLDDLIQTKNELLEKQSQILEEYKHQVAVDLKKSQKEVKELSIIIEKLAKAKERNELITERLVNSRGAKCEYIKELRCMRSAFSTWKEFAEESKKLKKLQTNAENYRHHKLLSKYFNEWRIDAWKSKKIKIEEMWRKRMEEVTNNLVRQYESELATVRQRLEEAEDVNQKYRTEREAYQEEMKKAFMKGVSALNLEAMSIFPKNNTASSKALNSSRAAEISMEISKQVSTPIQQATSTQKANLQTQPSPSKPGAIVVTRHQHSQPLSTVKIPVLANTKRK